jgi:hypothetical protein
LTFFLFFNKLSTITILGGNLMRKFLALFLALSLVGGVAFAQDLGMTAGAEFGITDLDEAGDTAYLRPFFIYENDTLVDGLELYAEIGVPFWINPEFWMGVDLTLKGTYHLNLSALPPAGTLSIILESQTAMIAVDDTWAGALIDSASVLVPGIRYTHELDNLSLYGQIDVPFLLFSGTDGVDPFDFVGLDFTLGFFTDFGFGLELTIENWITWEDESSFFDYVYVTPFYEAGPLYAEVSFAIPTFEDGFKTDGLSITPEVQYLIMDNLQAFLNFTISGIGSDDGTGFGMGLGVMFSF